MDMYSSSIDWNTIYKGNTLLHYAVSEDYRIVLTCCLFNTDWMKRNMVSYLLSKGADPSIPNSNGKVPFNVMMSKYVKETDVKKLNDGLVVHQARLAVTAEQNRLAAEKEHAAALEAQRQRDEKARLLKEEQAAKRQAAIDANMKVIRELEEFLVLSASIPSLRSMHQAQCLVVDHQITTVDKLRVAFVQGKLKTAFDAIPIDAEDQERLSQALFAPAPSGRAATRVSPLPASLSEGDAADEAPVLSDCFLTHDWGVDESGRPNHERVSRVNAYLKSKGLVTWFDDDRMDGNVRRKMTEGIDNTLCLVVFITDRYRNKVNGSEDRDNCRYEFTYAVEQKGPQRMVPVVMEERMQNARDWRAELGAALGTKLYVNMVSDAEEVFESRCEEIYQRVRAVIGQSRRERGEVPE